MITPFIFNKFLQENFILLRNAKKTYSYDDIKKVHSISKYFKLSTDEKTIDEKTIYFLDDKRDK
jgi:hypothetical protein